MGVEWSVEIKSKRYSRFFGGRGKTAYELYESYFSSYYFFRQCGDRTENNRLSLSFDPGGKGSRRRKDGGERTVNVVKTNVFTPGNENPTLFRQIGCGTSTESPRAVSFRLIVIVIIVMSARARTHYSVRVRA